MESKILPLLTWRSAICDSALAPTTRHVALTLSLWMNERAGSAFPGVSKLVSATGLTDKAVRTHLHNLVNTGWLILVERGGMRGQKRRANEYQAVIPTPVPSTRVNVVPLTPVPRSADPCTTYTPSLNDLSKNSPIAEKPARQRDLIFDCLCELTRTDPVGLTNAGRGSLNRACKELRAVSAEPDEIRKRWSALNRRYPNAALTAPALVKHWAALGTNPKLPNLAVVRTIEEDRAEFAELMGET